eukprot:CAMPEP_0203754464 /NCGR_PEP_ID=MMETSP0098-20131031/8058_1 /ASSEMBLY_ACC=CAM_ASM_000208 /TAXON_ID=96639 /ORGANISM=" , Strain NY0313808BC1" /LENGTH=134 /DNA_ID=CAMNT_0050645485 /DNA_START=126 /DNA_END=527 /DNA_ORIENTATION=+
MGAETYPVVQAVPATSESADVPCAVREDICEVPNSLVPTCGAVYHRNPSNQLLELSKNKTSVACMFVRTGLSGMGLAKSWVVPEKIKLVSFMGGQGIDFSNAEFVHPTTTITVTSMMGSAHILVPRGVRVINNG